VSDAQAKEQFTPGKVHDLLATKVLKGEKTTLPPRNDPAVSDLCHSLNVLQYWVKLRTVHGTNSDRREQLAFAMRIVDTVLPPLGAEVAEALAWFDDGNLELTRQYREALDVISNLAKAVTEAGECAVLLHPALRLTGTVRWEQYARDLIALFRQALPASSKESGYRFLVAIMPDITGETPTFDAVKTHLKKDRPVKPAKSRPVKRGK
jgi:hypothetical protein